MQLPIAPVNWWLLGGVASAILAVLSVTWITWLQAKEKRKRAELESELTENLQALLIKELAPDLSKSSIGYLLELRNMLAHAPFYVKKVDAEAEASQRFEELKKRIDEIDARLPKEATLEKIASVNDAILGTHIEKLTEAVKRIEDNQLTKWDAAKVVFAILGAFGMLIGLIAGIIKLFV